MKMKQKKLKNDNLLTYYKKKLMTYYYDISTLSKQILNHKIKQRKHQFKQSHLRFNYHNRNALCNLNISHVDYNRTVREMTSKISRALVSLYIEGDLENESFLTIYYISPSICFALLFN